MKKTWLAIFAVAGMLVACNNAGSEGGEETTPETEMQAENEGTEMEADHADHEDHADHADHAADAEDMSSEEPANEVEETMEEVEKAVEKGQDNSEAMQTEVREVQSGEGLSKR